MIRLSDALARFAGHRTLLIATDFDGTLAEYGPDLDDTVPVPGGERALNELARLSNVTVMLVSGRRLSDLLPRFSALSDEIVAVGEHGAEWPGRKPEAHPAIESLAAGLAEITAGIDGAMVERKLFGVTVRHRAVEPNRVSQILEEAAAYLRESTAGFDPTPRVEFGRGVIDVSLVTTTKADAVDSVRQSVGAGAVLYAGDDVSDESVFEILGDVDIGIKVGSAPSRAAYRVAEPRQVVSVLEELAYFRQ